MADENGRGAAVDFPDGSGPGGSVGGLDDDSCADELGLQRAGAAVEGRAPGVIVELLGTPAGDRRDRRAPLRRCREGLAP